MSTSVLNSATGSHHLLLMLSYGFRFLPISTKRQSHTPVTKSGRDGVWSEGPLASYFPLWQEVDVGTLVMKTWLTVWILVSSLFSGCGKWPWMHFLLLFLFLFFLRKSCCMQWKVFKYTLLTPMAINLLLHEKTTTDFQNSILTKTKSV